MTLIDVQSVVTAVFIPASVLVEREEGHYHGCHRHKKRRTPRTRDSHPSTVIRKPLLAQLCRLLLLFTQELEKHLALDFLVCFAQPRGLCSVLNPLAPAGELLLAPCLPRCWRRRIIRAGVERVERLSVWPVEHLLREFLHARRATEDQSTMIPVSMQPRHHMMLIVSLRCSGGACDTHHEHRASRTLRRSRSTHTISHSK